MHYHVSEEGGVTVIAFHGEIDLEYSVDARRVLLEGVSKGRAVIVDMAGVRLIDSSGVASLLEALQNARKKRKELILATVGDAVARVFQLARLYQLFVLEPTVDAARARLGGKRPTGRAR